MEFYQSNFFMKNFSVDLLVPELRTNEMYNETFHYHARFGKLTGLLVLLFFHNQYSSEKIKNRIWFLIKSPIIQEFFIVTICFLAFLLLLPIILLTLTYFRIKRNFDEKKLRNDKTSSFVSFLEGGDIMWACESEEAKAIVNVLGYVRVSSEDASEKLLQSIRDRFHSNLVVTNKYPKIFYHRRKSDSGYFYWSDENKLTINDYVRFLDQDNVEIFQSEGEFRKELSELSNQPLPDDNKALWECLVSRRMIRIGDDIKCPVVIRVHHSLSDGVAFLRLLLEAIADKVDFDTTKRDSMMFQKENFSEKLMSLLIKCLAFIQMPSFLLRSNFKKEDLNPIHPTRLSGNKKVNWIYETESNETCASLLTTVTLLKRHFDGVTFSSLLLAAITKSMRDFFTKRNYDIPEGMTVVLPARLRNCNESPKLKLENKFSVALQTLPVDVKLMNSRINKIQQGADLLKSSPEYLINFWMMSYISTFFPESVLKPLLASNSKQITLAASNLAGPNFKIKINGFEFDNIGFFLPNIAQTACGITILSYNNKLHFGIIADEAAIATEDDLCEILEGMVEEIKSMAESILK